MRRPPQASGGVVLLKRHLLGPLEVTQKKTACAGCVSFQQLNYIKFLGKCQQALHTLIPKTDEG